MKKTQANHAALSSEVSGLRALPDIGLMIPAPDAPGESRISEPKIRQLSMVECSHSICLSYRKV